MLERNVNIPQLFANKVLETILLGEFLPLSSLRQRLRMGPECMIWFPAKVIQKGHLETIDHSYWGQFFSRSHLASSLGAISSTFLLEKVEQLRHDHYCCFMFMAVQRVTTNPLVETTTPNEWLVCHWLLGFQTPPQLKAVAHQVHKIGSGDVSHVELLKVVKTCCFWISHSNFGRNCKNRIRKFKSQVLISSPYPWWWNSNQEETRTPHTSSLKRTAFSKSCVRGLLPTRNSLKHVARRVPLVTKSWNCSSSSISLDPYVTHW